MTLYYNYFISYSHSLGFGNVDYLTNYRLKKIEDIRRLEKDIKIRNGVDGVIILNWRLLGIKLKFK